MDRLPTTADAAEGVFEDEERVVGAMVVLGEVLSGPLKDFNDKLGGGPILYGLNAYVGPFQV